MPHHIVVIEDNPHNARLAQKLLRRADPPYEVHMAEDGESGYDMALETNPDLVLVDLGLPDLDGQTVVAMLRQQPEMASIPIIAFTAWPQETAHEMAAAYGCDGVITKPIDTRSFADRIREFLEMGVEGASATEAAATTEAATEAEATPSAATTETATEDEATTESAATTEAATEAEATPTEAVTEDETATEAAATTEAATEAEATPTEAATEGESTDATADEATADVATDTADSEATSQDETLEPTTVSGVGPEDSSDDKSTQSPSE